MKMNTTQTTPPDTLITPELLAPAAFAGGPATPPNTSIAHLGFGAAQSRSVVRVPECGPVSPFIRWAGGKARQLPTLMPLVGEVQGRYYEPFLGGGALFFGLASAGRLHGGATLSDVNGELMAAYTMLSGETSHEQLIGDLHGLERLYRAAEDPEELYYTVRETSLAGVSTADIAARFLFLNRTNFNGIYRQNRSGGYNVPWGQNPEVTICHEGLLRDAHRVLSSPDVEVCHASAFALLAERDIGPGDFVYIDPPYIPVKATATYSFYTHGGFGQGEQQRLAQLVRGLIDKGARVMVSNSDTPMTRELYAGLPLVEVRARRSINCDGSNRGPVGELIVLGNIAVP